MPNSLNGKRHLHHPLLRRRVPVVGRRPPSPRYLWPRFPWPRYAPPPPRRQRPSCRGQLPSRCAWPGLSYNNRRAAAPPLDFAPLASGGPARKPERRATGPPPALMAGAGAAPLAVVALIWILAGNRGDVPAKLRPGPRRRPSPQPQTGIARSRRCEAPTHIAQNHRQSRGRRSRHPRTKTRRTWQTLPPLKDEPSVAEAHGDEPEAEGNLGMGGRLPPRAAPPRCSAVQAAVAEIQSLLKTEYAAAKKVGQKVALAEKLLGLAQESDIPTERFALLSEANRLAIACRGIRPGATSDRRPAAEWTVDRLTIGNETIGTAGDKELPAAAREGLVEVLLPLVDEAAADGRYDLARRLASSGLAAARKTNDGEVVKSLSRRARDITAQEKLAQAAEEAREGAERKPNDGQAHLKLGKFLCLIVGDWTDGPASLAAGERQHARLGRPAGTGRGRFTRRTSGTG